MDGTETHPRYQPSNFEEFGVNVEMCTVIGKSFISNQEKLQEIKKLLARNFQPDINAQDGNDNWNTALHLAIERNELEVVNFLLSEGADITIENGDGKTPLQLAEECNHVEISDALKSCTSQVECPAFETDSLTSHTSQPVAANPNEVLVFHSNSHGEQTASTVLPPFSGKLVVDTELKLSHDDFKKSFDEFYGNKQLSPIDQLKVTPPYPTPHVLAQFANMAYRDYKHGDPKPPEGWKLLTTASHFGMMNGYFGIAYWHPEHQQVVIAHRGTDIKNFGALVTDVEGVLFNNYVNQMSSASTFANKVVAVLQEIEQEKKVSFEVFFTGHSLGGWLAQITTFTTEYLEVKGGTFLKKLKTEQEETPSSSTVQDGHVRQSYHPHTVVFDNPGCKDMLSQMTEKLDVHINGRSIDPQHLDISSYLSAPNPINTCNSHLGTVYRIFTDLSDMGFFGKYSTIYNLAAHNMDKIVQAFDPETGQVYKDDEGRLKIREVVDWPVSAGLSQGAGLNNFFEWAEHLNNYHPEVIDTVYSEAPKGYHTLRYQTKTFDECAKSISVFTDDEREFLERYCWLCHVMEFLKPEDLFCVLNNIEAEKEAGRKLRNLELGNESFRCSGSSILPGLIPYVKRLIRLFPHVKEKIKSKLSSPEIRNRVYQYETQRYVAKIDRIALDFTTGGMGLREFLTSHKQIWHLRMIDGDAWTGITKVYRVLQKTFCTPSYFSEGHYTILKLKQLLTDNRMINLNALLTSMETPHLLMIACGTNQPVNDELKGMFEELFNIVKQKKTLKIILTTQPECCTQDFIQQNAREILGEGFITTHEQLTWSDLTASSQKAMLEKTVIFQGKRVALNQLTSAESMTDSFPLADLLHAKEFRIGEEPVLSVSSGYNEKCYIDRTFNHNIVIRQDISSDKRDGKFPDILASTEQEFKQLCEQNPTSNVHWLVKDKSGELVWQQSQGDLKALRKYIDAQKFHSYAPRDLDKLLQQAKKQKIMLITDKAGTGKTTVLTHLSKRIKQKFPAHWLVRIDLNDYTELLKAQKGKMDKGRVLEFISKEVLKLESHLEKELFEKSFEGNGVNKLVVMVDGFDKISPIYKEAVIDMLQILKQTSLEQLWVTTRHHLKEELEDSLQQLSYTLQPFSEVEQVEFLNKFWLQTSNLEDTNQHKFQIYAKALIKKLAQSISDEDKEFTGIPLQTRMLAEAFEKEFRSFYLSEKAEPEFPHKLDLLGLYRRFIERKYDIYYREKSKTTAGNIAALEQRERDFKHIQSEHQRLALEALFTEDEVTFLQSDNHATFSDEELARIGLAQRNHEGKTRFIHRTFAEYFVAAFLINHLTKKTNQHTQVQQILLKVLLQTDSLVIRAFLDGLLEKSQPSEEALKEYGDLLDEQWNERELHLPLTCSTTILHTAATEDNASIIGFILDSLKSGEHSVALTKMLLATDKMERTAWHMAAENGSVQAIEKIWRWAENVTHTLTYSQVLSKDIDSKTGWQLVSERGCIEVVEKMRSWTNEVRINTGELRKKILLAQDSERRTAWHVAAQRGSVEILDILWGWAEELQLTQNELNELLLAVDKHGNTAIYQAACTGSIDLLEKLCAKCMEKLPNPDELRKLLFAAWQRAAAGGYLEILERLWLWAGEVQLNPHELQRRLLLEQTKNGASAWHVAAAGGRVEVLEKLWGWAKEKINRECLKSVLFLPEDSGSFSTWCYAIREVRTDVIEKLWGWAEELQLTTNQLNNLLLDVDKNGNTAIYQAASAGNVKILDKLWELSKETQLNPNELSKLIFVAWHEAATRGHLEILERLWLWAGEVQRNPHELHRRLLLDQNEDGETAWHMAAAGGHVEVLEKLWGWAKEEQINADDLRSAIVLAQNKRGKSALHLEIRCGKVMELDRFLDFVKEMQLYPGEVRNNLSLDQEEDGRPAWLLAAKSGNVKILEELWVLAKEKGNTEEIKSKLLLAQNEYGQTALHVAAEGSVAVLEKLWAFAKEGQLNQDELQNKLLLNTDMNGYTAWHRAAEGGSLKALETLWIWSNEGELKLDELLLSQTGDGVTALHMASQRNHVDILHKLWVWAEEIQINPNELKKKMFLARDSNGYTAWHRAAQGGRLEALEILWSSAKEVEINTEELLLSQTGDGFTAFQIAAEKNRVDTLQKLWVWTEKTQLNPNELKKKMFLAKDKYGYIAWHQAADEGSLDALEVLWSCAKEAGLSPSELLLAETVEGETAFLLAAENNHVETLKKLWVWAEETQLNPNVLKKKLLQAQEKDDVLRGTDWQ